jgi:trk system potassium uptake protein TrkH
LSILVCGVAIFALLAVQTYGLSAAASRGAFMAYAFEAVSAFATVGLSLGVTPTLLPAGKLIIIGLMFIGRVGILTLAFAFAQRSRRKSVIYSQEQIMIG